jgi:SAM-dependent methyltransferase
MTLRHDPLLGTWAPGSPWVPMPRYLLRRDRVLALLRDVPRGRLLEVGCGAGALLRDFHGLGFSCFAAEGAEPARTLAARLNAGTGSTLRAEIDPAWEGTMDVLVSMEVLEHLEDDRGALSAWIRCLKPGGLVLVGVPCHRARWGPLDEWAGHVRRYDREELVALLEGAGATVERFECYGFPLANLTSWLRNRRLRRQGNGPELDEAARTARSGIDRTGESGLFRHLRRPWGRLALRLACRLQRLFAGTELGDGYLVVARLRPPP